MDLNYTQYCPLSEPYVGLYPKKGADADDDSTPALQPEKKPLVWFEVEKSMAEGTLTQLRNRTTSNLHTSKPLELRPAKFKAVSKMDMTGLNRRERRKHLRGENVVQRQKSKSTGFEKNQEFGASQSAPMYPSKTSQDHDNEEGFFED